MEVSRVRIRACNQDALMSDSHKKAIICISFSGRGIELAMGVMAELVMRVGTDTLPLSVSIACSLDGFPEDCKMNHGALSAHISTIWELSRRTACVSDGSGEMKYEAGS